MANRYDSLKKTSRHRPPAAWRLPVLFFLLILTSAAGGFVFLNAERFALRVIEINGNRLLTEEMIVAAARQALTGRRWFFFRRDRYWFYSPTQLSAALGARLTRLAAVEVKTTGWNTLQFQITERHTAALWCPKESVLMENCFYLDETGLAFAPAPRFSAPPLVVITGTEPAITASSSPPLIKSQPLPRSSFRRLWDLKLSLENFFQAAVPFNNFIVQKITAVADGDYKFYFTNSYQLATGFEIIVANTQTAAEILDRLESVLAVPKFKTELTSAAKLEYLDLRFDRKVFYRFRE